MIRIEPTTASAVALAVTLGFGATSAAAQAHDHADADHAHHAGGPVECTTLATPPWSGLPSGDLERIRTVEEVASRLASADAASEAGFRPVLGNIPTMGVHWVHPDRMRDGFDLEEPDHLLFAPVDGEDRLVGAAYAFRGPAAADAPEAFESELAAWHDHPQFAGPGESLHMLHVWFVPSPYGPFAGNNFLLPYYGAGVEPPDPCWISTEADVERFELAASALAMTQLGDDRSRPGVFERLIRERMDPERWAERRAALGEHIARLDEAARAGDGDAWAAAADDLLDGLTPLERRIVEGLRRGVTEAQVPSTMRGDDSR